MQLTKDGVLLINHDAMTGRTFNRDVKIQDEKYFGTLDKLRNVSPPFDGMLTFEKLLEWCLSKWTTGSNKFQIFLDIKVANNQSILDHIISAFKKLRPLEFWFDKIIFGLWNLEFYEYAISKNQLLANFEIFNISFSPTISRKFIQASERHQQEDPEGFKMPISGLSVSHVATWHKHNFYPIYQLIRKHNLKFYTWTVNKEEDLKWVLDLQADGIMTDFPEAAVAIRSTYCNSSLYKANLAGSVDQLYDQFPVLDWKKKLGIHKMVFYRVFRAFEKAKISGLWDTHVPFTKNRTFGSYGLHLLKFLGII